MTRPDFRIHSTVKSFGNSAWVFISLWWLGSLTHFNVLSAILVIGIVAATETIVDTVFPCSEFIFL